MRPTIAQDKWYYRPSIDSPKIGPVPWRRVNDLAEYGVITASSLLRRDGDEKWRFAKALMQRFSLDETKLPVRGELFPEPSAVPHSLESASDSVEEEDDDDEEEEEDDETLQEEPAQERQHDEPTFALLQIGGFAAITLTCLVLAVMSPRESSPPSQSEIRNSPGFEPLYNAGRDAGLSPELADSYAQNNLKAEEQKRRSRAAEIERLKRTSP